MNKREWVMLLRIAAAGTSIYALTCAALVLFGVA